MNDLKKMIADRLRGFGAEIVANNDLALVQFRQTPSTLAKAVMPVFPEDPEQLFEEVFEFWIELDEPGVVCFRGKGNEKKIPRKFYFLLSQAEAQNLDARNLVEFVVSMQRTGIPYAWQPFAHLPGFPGNVLTHAAVFGARSIKTTSQDEPGVKTTIESSIYGRITHDDSRASLPALPTVCQSLGFVTALGRNADDVASQQAAHRGKRCLPQCSLSVRLRILTNEEIDASSQQ